MSKFYMTEEVEYRNGEIYLTPGIAKPVPEVLTEKHTNPTSCCGLHEYGGLYKNGAASLFRMAVDRYQRGMVGGIILFTDKITSEKGVNLKTYIEMNKLGQVWKTDPVVNPNTSNKIEAFLYAPDDTKLKPWFDAAVPKYTAEIEADNAWAREQINLPFYRRIKSARPTYQFYQ